MGACVPTELIFATRSCESCKHGMDCFSEVDFDCNLVNAWSSKCAIPTIMHQSVPSTNIPPGRPPGKFFKVVKNPALGQNVSAKARPPGQENTYPRGVL